LGTELSTSYVNRLGDRLRKDKPQPSDVEALDAFRRSFDEAQQTVVRKLRELGLEPSVRIKTTISIVQKLKRESIRLSKLQDVAGCRVVVNDVMEQDRVVGIISGAFAKAEVADRRRNPSHGYRAVHVIIDVDRRLVEVQIRTELQHLWAEFSETLAGALDQSIKYGGGAPVIQENLLSTSETIALIELGQRRVRDGFNKQQTISPAEFNKFLSAGQLPPSLIENLELVRDFTDLLQSEVEMKERINRDILKLKSERQTS
jgi:ppGpp synthetase/RelA/SpoT-type nucleotidyltranferase